MSQGFPHGTVSKEPTCQRRRWKRLGFDPWVRRVWSLGQEDPLEEGMATHSSILAWRIPWTEEAGGLQSMGLQRVRHDWINLACTQLYHMFTSVQLLSRVQLFVTPWTAACQASLSITNSWSISKLMSIKSVMPSNHLILCCPLLLLTSIFPSIRVFSNESALHIRWPKYWSFSFNISLSKEYSGLISLQHPN